MQAQHGEIEVTADQDINVTSCKRKITIPAQKEVLLTSGGAYIRIKDGKIELQNEIRGERRNHPVIP